MSEITHVCFDIGGVANVRPLASLILSAAQKQWNDFSEEKWKKMVQPKLDGRDVWREFQNGQINADEYVNAAFRSAEIPSTLNNKIFFYRLLEDWCGTSYQPVLDLVDRLKQDGYHTSVLSNNNEIMYITPSAEAIKQRVEVAISSHEIGHSKPHWNAFCVLLDKIKPEVPREVVFVDDQEKIIEAANTYGLQGIHFRSKQLGMDHAFEELLKSLKEKGVRI
ncbi:MAG TPA: HAD family hydrolase [Candidatus Nanoarchaeia archaeon]|nr:HAD family hydrolase [Candidatus Nanoarchaeia archaeon]